MAKSVAVCYHTRTTFVPGTLLGTGNRGVSGTDCYPGHRPSKEQGQQKPCLFQSCLPSVPKADCLLVCASVSTAVRESRLPGAFLWNGSVNTCDLLSIWSWDDLWKLSDLPTRKCPSLPKTWPCAHRSALESGGLQPRGGARTWWAN